MNPSLCRTLALAAMVALLGTGLATQAQAARRLNKETVPEFSGGLIVRI